MAKYNNRFIALDTETGGLCSKTKSAFIDIALTEIAVVAIDNESLEIIDKNSWLIAPYDDNLEYNAEAAKVSGITKQMVIKEGLNVEDVYKNLVKFLKSHTQAKTKPIIIIQNKSFDLPFLENMFAIFNDNFHSYIERVEDTLIWARMKWIEKPNFKLGSIAEYCKLDLVNAHRAMPDTITTALIWIEFMKSLRGKNINTSENKEEINNNNFRTKFKF